ncbi:pyridoxamine 5'-phosphate oxidase [Stieleria varia]|uniref:Pyridoxine/pyridoxamine 5'-phosphate oxidase n=1 Tax=Stieleria varia TaxID=2528005 RepID=A0A5C6B3X5_9BACT|nr:pyridoxamine 5'-phosphate oxidase [Stieleria varia]TWU06252.1 Pyridoxine/pyridoxamine 5'-phosphate oxidase [Stieleria varia]
MNLEEMRQSYSMAGLSEKDMADDPLVQFQSWLVEALNCGAPDWLEVNAMTLATTDGHGSVTSRIVLLKALEDDKFWFFTNYESIKGRQMQACPKVSLCFHWPHVQRQVRIDGTVEKATRERSETYFQSRPRDSQLGAVASNQSDIVADRETLERAMESAAMQFDGQTIPCPEHWGGYGVTPHSIEFWQGRVGRLHDRIHYTRSDHQWIMQRLSP